MTTTLLTGLPRSGTTLLCSLLNALPDSVALAEPMRIDVADPDMLLAAVESFVRQTRENALSKGSVPGKLINGSIGDNFVVQTAKQSGLRRSVAKIGLMPVGKPLSPGFRLYIKHPAAFTAAAAALQSRYTLFAVIRHPLSVLASWQTVDLPVHDGRLPVAERISPHLRNRLESIPERLPRQVEIMRWFLEVYRSLPRSQIIRYEDLTTAPEHILARLHPMPGRVDHAIRIETAAQRYPGVDLAELERALDPIAALIAQFYPPAIA